METNATSVFMILDTALIMDITTEAADASRAEKLVRGWCIRLASVVASTSPIMCMGRKTVTPTMGVTARVAEPRTL